MQPVREIQICETKFGNKVYQMCVHYVIQQPDAVLAYAKSMADVFDLHGETLPGNAWPKTKLPVIVNNDGIRTLTMMRWGVLAPFAQSTSGKYEYIANARDDSLLTKSIWRDAVQHRRCLIPADGFYEWAGEKGAKYEAMFRMTNSSPFFFAGVWSNAANETQGGYAIVTGSPNALVAALPHNRMPVILKFEQSQNWLNSKPLPIHEQSRLLAPYPELDMERIVG